MKKILLSLLFFPILAHAQTYSRFGPANGILKGATTTYVTTAAVAADAIGLWSGTCNSTTFLRGDGSCQVPPGTGTGVNLTDNPTWTGLHTWSSTEPRHLFYESDQGTDLKLWDIDLGGGVLCVRTRTDADGAGQNVLCATRGTTTTLTNMTFGYAVSGTYTFAFTGTAAFSGPIQPTRLNFNATSTAPNLGIYAPAGNTFGISVNSALRASWDINGALLQTGAIVSGGTKFTASGCSNSTTVGGATAGKFSSGTTGTCAVTVTLPTAPNGWTCYASDLTTPVVFTQTASATTSCTISATTVSGDVVTFVAMAY